ncbi:MAG: ABC transporter permease subunit, partial [Deltaproteobacteria bacterium]|nr:ABC transporter permease subunit [Deltaproteobacteria bacterium]
KKPQLLARPVPSALSQENKIRWIGMDEYRKRAYLLYESGHIVVFHLATGKRLLEKRLVDEPIKITSSFQARGSSSLLFGTNRGELGRVELIFEKGLPRLSRLELTPLSLLRGRSILHLASSGGERGEPVIVSTEGEIAVARTSTSGQLDAEELTGMDPRSVTTLSLSVNGEDCVAGSAGGGLYYWDLQGASFASENRADAPRGQKVPAVTAVAFLRGDESLIVGREDGALEQWFKKKGSGWAVLEFVRSFESHSAPVMAIAPSPFGRLFSTGDGGGELYFHHATAHQTRLKRKLFDEPVKFLAFGGKGDGLLALGQRGSLYSVDLHDPHPEISYSVLFQPVRYEGYSESEYVWQSTGGDDSEPKMSLVPLIFGTLKGTLYALLFSVPMALFAAIYISQLTSAGVRSSVKPIIELMAGIPSVVVGLVAGLWISPLIEKHFAFFLTAIVTVHIAFAAALLLCRLLPDFVHMRIKHPVVELAILFGVMTVGALLAIVIERPVERVFFGGDIHQWLNAYFGMVYDPRNCIVVGIALGFAVVPIIFTIAEDAMSSVPKTLVSAALALGANRWEAAYKVVLPAAAPGVFAAILLGLGRAIGETMIVLMATGNTPIIDWSVFNGMRTLSANIAVEIPEAPVGGTLYRVLFLTALLLFIFTFIVNSIGDLVSQRLRKRYSRF